MTGFFNLIGTSVTRPQEAASTLFGLGLSREVAWLLLGASTALSVVLSFLMQGAQAAQIVEGMAPFSPMMLALFLGCSSVITGYAIHYTGQAMDGEGSLTNSMLLVAWFQVLQLAGLVVQALALPISPGFSDILRLMIGLGLIWVFLSFVNVLHAFGSLGRSALLMLFVIVGIGLGLTLILGLIGVGL